MGPPSHLCNQREELTGQVECVRWVNNTVDQQPQSTVATALMTAGDPLLTVLLSLLAPSAWLELHRKQHTTLQWDAQWESGHNWVTNCSQCHSRSTHWTRASQNGGQTPNLSAWKQPANITLSKCYFSYIYFLALNNFWVMCEIFLEQTSFQPSVLGYSGHFLFLRKLAARSITEDFGVGFCCVWVVFLFGVFFFWFFFF